MASIFSNKKNPRRGVLVRKVRCLQNDDCMSKRTAALAPGVARRLKAQREERGLSQRELGERSGVSHRTIGLIEMNRGGAAGIDTIEALARALGVRPAWLAYGDGEP